MIDHCKNNNAAPCPLCEWRDGSLNLGLVACLRQVQVWSERGPLDADRKPYVPDRWSKSLAEARKPIGVMASHSCCQNWMKIRFLVVMQLDIVSEMRFAALKPHKPSK